MLHLIYKISSVKIMAPYTLEIQFDDSEKQTINFEPVLHGEMYGPLRNLSLFNQVKIDPEIFTVVWPNGADFDPAILRNWNQYINELSKRAEDWELVIN